MAATRENRPFDVCYSLSLYNFMAEHADKLDRYAKEITGIPEDLKQQMPLLFKQLGQLHNAIQNEAHMQMMEPPHKLPCMGPFVS